MIKISTRGRYAVRFMIDLAEHDLAKPVTLREISERQDISLKYLELIASDLSKSSLISSRNGKGGGYKLLKSSDDYTVWDILDAVEGNLAPVACLEGSDKLCPRMTNCRTVKMWREYYKLTKDYFTSITLSNLIEGYADGGDYCI